MKIHEAIEQAVALERKATKGPWESEHPDIYGDMADGSPGVLLYEDWEATEEDSALIVALRNLLVPLAAYVGELEAQVRISHGGFAALSELAKSGALRVGPEMAATFERRCEALRSALLLRDKEVPDAES